MKKRIFNFFDGPVPVPDAVADGGGGEGDRRDATEVKTSDELVGALADPNVTTIKLMGEITVNATENVKELTIDRQSHW